MTYWKVQQLRTISKYAVRIGCSYGENVYNYSKNGVSYRYSKSFPQMWLASSFKGFLRPYTNSVPTQKHLENQQSNTTELLKRNIECTGNGRMLSVREAMYSELNQTASQYGIFFQVNTLESIHPITDSLVRQSFYELSKLHFFLKANINKDNSRNYFFREMTDLDENMNWIPLHCIHAESTSDWVAIVNNTLKNRIDFEHGPLWKAVWVTCRNNKDINSYMLIFFCTHAIIEAKGAFDLLANQFLPILNNLLSGKEPNLLTKPIFLSLSMEQIFFNTSAYQTSVAGYRVPWYIKAGIKFALWKNRVFSSPDKKPSIRVVEEEMSGEAPCHYPFTVDLDTTIKLKILCKKESVSVHSILLICMHNALKKAENKYEELRISNRLFYAIDLRRYNKFLSTSPMPLGCFLSINEQNMRPTDINESIRYAQVITKSLKSQITPTYPLSSLAIVAYLLRNDLISEIFDGIGMPEMINLSNLGNCEIVDTGNVKLVDHYYSMPLRHGLFISTATLNDCMFFCIAADSRWCSEGFMKFIADEITHSVKELVSNENM